ncbi:hypothetical protein [Streptomyces sp. Tue6028]
MTAVPGVSRTAFDGPSVSFAVASTAVDHCPTCSSGSVVTG